MTRFLRQLVVSAVLTVALAAGASAQSEHVALVTYGPDGLILGEPTDTPVGDAPAALLRMTETGGWILKSLSPGDIPSEVLETMERFSLPVRSESLTRARDLASWPTRERVSVSGLSRNIVELAEIEPQRTVLFEVTAQYNLSDMEDALVDQLTENAALRRLEVSDKGGHGALDARFVFDSVEEWNEWKAVPETEAMLDALRGATRQMQTRMEVRQ